MTATIRRMPSVCQASIAIIFIGVVFTYGEKAIFSRSRLDIAHGELSEIGASAKSQLGCPRRDARPRCFVYRYSVSLDWHGIRYMPWCDVAQVVPGLALGLPRPAGEE